MLTSDTSTENVRSIDVLTFRLSHDSMVKTTKQYLSLQTKQKRNKILTTDNQRSDWGKLQQRHQPKRAHTMPHTYTQRDIEIHRDKQQRLHCGLRSPWSLIKFHQVQSQILSRNCILENAVRWYRKWLMIPHFAHL